MGLVTRLRLLETKIKGVNILNIEGNIKEIKTTVENIRVFSNIDGGTPDTDYSTIDSIDGGIG